MKNTLTATNTTTTVPPITIRRDFISHTLVSLLRILSPPSPSPFPLCVLCVVFTIIINTILVSGIVGVVVRIKVISDLSFRDVECVGEVLVEDQTLIEISTPQGTKNT